MTLGEIATLLSGDLHGPADLAISGPVDAFSEEKGGIAFAESAEFLAKAEASGASALLLPRGLASEVKPYVQVDHVRPAFLRLLQGAVRPLPLHPGVHPTAVVDPGADVAADAQIGAYAVIERGARVAGGCRVYPFAYIGEDCVLEEGCVVYPHAVLYQSVTLGKGTVVHAGAVLGADGFGYVWNGSERVKVPQVGAVSIGPGCEIGALTTIDRATMGATVVGAGSKIDNLVQVAHNVRIGEHAAIAAQAGIAGSSSLGDRVMMGGQAGVADHVALADDVVLGGRAAALQRIDQPGLHLGYPAQPEGPAKRGMLLLTKLPELFSRVRKLEKKVGQ